MERPRRPAEVGRSGREPGGGPEGGPVGRAEEEAGWASASFRQEKGTSAGSHGPQRGPRPPSDRQTEEGTGLIRKHFGGSVFSRTSFLKNKILLLQKEKMHFLHLTSKQNQIPKSNFMLKEEERNSFRGRERHKRKSLFCKKGSGRRAQTVDGGRLTHTFRTQRRPRRQHWEQRWRRRRLITAAALPSAQI